MQRIEHFSTDRLTAEPMAEKHFPTLFRMWQDPRVTERTGAESEEQSRARMDGHLAHWQLHGFGRWIFRDNRSKEIVGYCGLRHR